MGVNPLALIETFVTDNPDFLYPGLAYFQRECLLGTYGLDARDAEPLRHTTGIAALDWNLLAAWFSAGHHQAERTRLALEWVSEY